MVTSKIILLLRKLDKKELIRLREFLNSPFFNNKRKIVQFYDRLLKFAPEFDSSRIKRTEIYSALYPSSKFNAQVYKNLSSELYMLAREFLAISNYRSNDTLQNIDLLEKLESNGSDELYRSELNTLKEKLNKSSYSEIHFLYKFRIALIERSFLYHRSKRAKLNSSGVEESNELLKYYFIHAFRQRFDFESLGMNFNIRANENPAMAYIRKQLDTGLIQETIDHMQAAKSKDHEIVAIFYYILMSFRFPENDTYFRKAKELVFTSNKKFDRPFRVEVSDALYGLFSFRMMHNPSIENYRETFDIINFRLKKKIFRSSEKSYFDAISFRAIFLTGVRLKEYEWLKKFTKKYIPEVTPEHRENLFNLLSSFNKFFEKKFEDSLEYLSRVKYDINLYKLDVRKLQLLNYYELDLTENAISLISSFREFLNNNKELTEDERIKNTKIVNFCARLLKLKESHNDFELLELQKEIEKTPNFLYREWFLDKIDEINALKKK